jgi:hypothetical protein
MALFRGANSCNKCTKVKIKIKIHYDLKTHKESAKNLKNSNLKRFYAKLKTTSNFRQLVLNNLVVKGNHVVK